MKINLIINFLVSTTSIVILLGCSDTIPEEKITKADFGKEWPFSYDEAIIKCYSDDAGKAPVVIVNGQTYGLTGYADNMYGAKDVNAINKVWVKDQSLGLMVDLGPVTDKATTLCK